MIAPKNHVRLRPTAESSGSRSESLAGKAGRIYNQYAQPLEYKHLGTGYQYKFDREKLTPDYLTTHDLKVKADAFLACKNGNKSFDLLRELGAAERVYSSPKMSLENWFGNMIIDLPEKRPNVRLDFNEFQKTTLKDLLENISKNGLSKDARTLLLFGKALNNIIDLTVHDAINPHVLNFGFLTPARMKENITNKKIEDIIDSSNSKTITGFLKETGALVIVIKKISYKNLLERWPNLV